MQARNSLGSLLTPTFGVKGMNREVTKQERNWLIKGLSTLETGKYFGGGRWIDSETGKQKPLDEPIDPDYLLGQVDHLRVVSKCDCGEPDCHTVRFQNFESGKSVALVCDSTDDGRILIIHINEDSGLLAELEVI